MTREAAIAGDYMRGFQPPWSLDLRRAALVVVDMQYATGSRAHGLGAMRNAAEKGSYLDYRFTRIETVVIPAVQALLSASRRVAMPVIYLVLGSDRADCGDLVPHLRAFTAAVGNRVGSPVHRILDEITPRAADTILRKTTVGGFASTDIGEVLRRQERDQIVICGISTSYCVDQTAREAADRGFRVLVVEDAVAENEQSWHDQSLFLFERAFGRVSTSAKVIAELARGTPLIEPERPGP